MRRRAGRERARAGPVRRSSNRRRSECLRRPTPESGISGRIQWSAGASAALLVVLGWVHRYANGLWLCSHAGAAPAWWRAGLAAGRATDIGAGRWLVWSVAACAVYAAVVSGWGRRRWPMSVRRFYELHGSLAPSPYAIALFRCRGGREGTPDWLATWYVAVNACVPTLRLATLRDRVHHGVLRREMAHVLDHLAGLAVVAAAGWALSAVGARIAAYSAESAATAGDTGASRAFCAIAHQRAGWRGRRDSLLVAAVGARQEAVAQVLLDCGASPDAVAPNGDAVLYLAVRERLPGLVAALAQQGANLEAISHDGKTATIGAAIDGDSALVRQLLAFGANPNGRGPGCPSALHAAAHRNLVLIGQALLDAGADPNSTDSDGSTPLHVACRRGCDQFAQLLVANGADTTALDNSGRTAADAAEEAGHGDLARTLHEAATGWP
jgi:hypothetical protein